MYIYIYSTYSSSSPDYRKRVCDPMSLTRPEGNPLTPHFLLHVFAPPSAREKAARPLLNGRPSIVSMRRENFGFSGNCLEGRGSLICLFRFCLRLDPFGECVSGVALFTGRSIRPTCGGSCSAQRRIQKHERRPEKMVLNRAVRRFWLGFSFCFGGLG